MRRPSGETAGSFSTPPVIVSRRELGRSVSVSHRWIPGLGYPIALTIDRLSGSQLNGAATVGRSGATGPTSRGAASLIGMIQNSGSHLGASSHHGTTQTPSFDPSGEKCSPVESE